MQRKYDVYITGKPLRFLGGSERPSSRMGLVDVEVGNKEQLHDAAGRLASELVHGVQIRSTKAFDAWKAFQAEHKFVLAAGGVVTDEKGRLLVIRRLGRWDLPKGKVEKNEGVEVGAVREVKEECGLSHVELLEPLTETWHTYDRKGKPHLKRTEWFLMIGSSKDRLTAQVEEDIQEVKWMTEAEVRTIRSETYPSLVPVIDAWLERRTDEGE